MRLYAKLALLSLRSQLSTRSSFVLTVLGNLLTPLTVLAGFGALFSRFGTVAGWTAGEILLCFGVAHCAFAVAECFARGFDLFPSVLSSGEFERILLRPQSVLVQTLGARFEFSRIGRLAVGLATLAAGVLGSEVRWDGLRIGALILMVFCGAVLFGGIFMIAASLCFVSPDSIEMVNVLTDGGRELCQYPLPIFGGGARRFFTYLVPFGCVNYLPLLFILGRADPLYAATPLLVFPFVVFCAGLWRAGVRRYMRTG